MRLITPRVLSCVHRVVESGSRHQLLVTLAYCFPFDRPTAPISATEMWKLVSTDLGRDGVLDHWMPKPQGEVIVSGACFPGSPQRASHTRLYVGSSGRKLIDKRLLVFGDRRWTPLGPSEPEPFTRMPIDYRHAFGGPGYVLNPNGKGFSSNADAGERAQLPNVEDPRHPIASRDDRMTPASFAGRDPVSLRSDNPTHLNVAPPDQRVRGYFEGDEELLIEHMHPEKHVLQTRLPGFRARCFVQRSPTTGASARWIEVGLNLDTIRVLPLRERAIVCFRGCVAGCGADGSDIDLVVGALDDPGDGSRPLEDFEATVFARAADAGSPQAVLGGWDLLPRSMQPSRREEAAALSRDNDSYLDRTRVALAEVDAVLERLLASGLDRDLVPNLLPLRAGHPEPAAASPRAKEKKASAREEHVRQMRAMASLHGEFTGGNTLSDPPAFSASREIERLERIVENGASDDMDLVAVRARLVDPGFRASLVEVERTLHRRYRLTAHLGDGARERLARVSSTQGERRTLLASARRGKRDFTGADLSGEDLSGLDLEGAFLEGANLSRANLSGANLKNAVLARANLEGASFDDATLDDANLGRVSANGANFRRASLRGAILYSADFEASDFRAADLRNADVIELNLTGANLAGAALERVVFRKAILEGASLRGARAARSVFIECRANQLDCSGADLAHAVFVRSTADRAVFRDVVADEMRVEASSFRMADFAGAALPGAHLRGADLERARLRGANLRRSDVSGADLRGADLTDAIATECVAIGTDLSGALLSGANLMLAIMHRAVLRGADLSRANLFCADLTAAISDDRTSLSGSNVKRALLFGGSP